jgi:hypothetical protein
LRKERRACVGKERTAACRGRLDSEYPKRIQLRKREKRSQQTV